MTEYTPTDAEIEAAAKALCEIDEMRLVLTFSEEAKAALVAAHKARQTHAPSEARAPEVEGAPSSDARKVAVYILSNWASRYINAPTQFEINTAIFYASVAIEEAIDRAAAPLPPAPTEGPDR